MSKLNLEQLDATALAAELRNAQRRNDWERVSDLIHALERGSFEGEIWTLLHTMLEGPNASDAARHITEMGARIEEQEVREEVETLAEAILDQYEDDDIREAAQWDDLPDIWDRHHETIEGSSLVFNYTEQKKVVRYLDPGDYVEEVCDLEAISTGNYASLAYGILYDAVIPQIARLFEDRKEKLEEEDEEGDDE